MTQYMLAVHGPDEDHATPTGGYADEAEMQEAFAAVAAFNEELEASGNFVFAGGLLPAPTATKVDNTGGSPIVTDGPYLESKEHLGGFWVIEVDDLDAAIKIAEGASKACKGVVEVRPFGG